MEPTLPDVGNGNVSILPPLLNDYMTGREKDRADQTASAFVNIRLQDGDQQTASIPDNTDRQTRSLLNTTGYAADSTRLASTAATAQQQDGTSWGSTLGNSLVDSIKQGGTSFGQTIGGAAANGVNNIVQNSITGKPKPDGGGGSTGGGSPGGGGGGSGGGSGGGGGTEPSAGGNTSGGDGGGGNQGVVGSQTNPDGTITVVYSCGNTWTGVPPAPPKCPKCGQGDQSSTTANNNDSGGTPPATGNTPPAPAPAKPTPKPTVPAGTASKGCICLLDGDHYGKMRYCIGCAVTGKNSEGAWFDAKQQPGRPTQCPLCGGAIGMFKDIAMSVAPPDLSNLKVPEPMKNPTLDQVKNVLNLK
ncbi:MAG: hypothetical protein NTY53_16995 [Kiritimatiellaeota bacterium]|nr:hypothetical protein [Kiritimatiellota bacterium]